ncbi:MAG: hypothetical protein AB7O62_14950 [Pirellulales bacterium]
MFALPDVSVAAINLLSGGLMDPFRACLALGPLGVYLLAIGLVNLARRPWLTTGFRDHLALGLGLSGLMVVGPLELLMPDRLIIQGWPAWLIWTGLYGLVLLLILAVQPPRLVIYNISAAELQPVLAELIEESDPDAHWIGNVLHMPRLGVQLQIDCQPFMRNAVVAAVGSRQSLRGWRELESRLSAALSRVEVAFHAGGLALSLLGAAVLLVISIQWFRDPQAVARGFWEMLRLR